MHVVGEALLYTRVFWEHPTTYQHKPHHHHQLHDRNQYPSSSSIFGSRVHPENYLLPITYSAIYDDYYYGYDDDYDYYDNYYDYYHYSDYYDHSCYYYFYYY